MRKLLASTAAGLALFGGGVAVAAAGSSGIAGAQENGQKAEQSQPGGGQAANRHPRRHLAKQLITEVARVLNMAPRDLLAELRSGKSIAQVAEAKGVPVQTVIDDLVAKVNERVDKALGAGKLTQEQAAKIKEQAPARIAKLVDRQLQGRTAGQR